MRLRRTGAAALAATRRGAGGACLRIRARVPDQNEPVRERHGQPSAERGRPDLRRGGRTPLRHGLGDEPAGGAGGDRAAAPLADERRHARHPAEAEPAAGLVSRLLARHLRRRAPRQGRVHVRDRPESRPGAPVRDPLPDRERRHARPARRTLVDVPLVHVCGRPAPAADVHRAGRAPASAGRVGAVRLDRVLRLDRGRADRDADLRRDVDRQVRAGGRVRPRDGDPAADVVALRALAARPRDRARPARGRRRDRDLARRRSAQAALDRCVAGADRCADGGRLRPGRPGARRPRRPDEPGLAVAAPRLDPPRRGLDLARRPRRTADPRRERRRRSGCLCWPPSCRASRASRSCR